MEFLNSLVGALIGNLIAQFIFSYLTSRNEDDEEYVDVEKEPDDWDPMCEGVWLNADGTKVEPTNLRK